jgi:hypothetical protein
LWACGSQYGKIKIISYTHFKGIKCYHYFHIFWCLVITYYYCSRSRVRSVIYARVYLCKSRNTPRAWSTSSLRLAVRHGYGACALYHSPAYYTFAAAVPVCFRISSETRRPTFASELSRLFIFSFFFLHFFPVNKFK